MNGIKFEIINGQLCRMMEPEPLMPDSKFPCMVRLIQDETPMGLYHKDLFRADKDEYSPKICDEVRDINDLSDSNRGSVIHSDGIVSAQYYHFEIIGYPVADGSAEWMIYHAMQGKLFVNKEKPLLYYSASKDGMVRGRVIEGDLVVEIYNPETFIEKFPAGWQLYTEPQTEPCEICGGIGMISCEACNATGRVPIEPEPKPSYAVGDWVEYFDNAELCHAQIDEIDSDYCTINPVVGWDRTLQRIRITCITRKLKPSEVIVHIGCLRGTVKLSYDSDGTLLTDEFILYLDDVKNAIIAKAMLDEPTAKLIKDLLEKQKDGK